MRCTPTRYAPTAAALRLLVAYQVARTSLWDRLVEDEAGEGVISSAIAVLVMAFLGAAMWVGFKTMWEDTEGNTKDKVAEIGE